LEISDPYMDSVILTSKIENNDAYKKHSKWGN
jgi:hypothetical protein